MDDQAMSSNENAAKALNWFLSFISDNEWKRRKEIIEKYLSSLIMPEKPLTENATLVVKEDLIGWYMYLVDMMLHEPYKYEFFQGSRVLPVFCRLGYDLDLLKGIQGIEKKVKELLKKKPKEADAFLFEFLTALLWSRNGYEVSFVDEIPGKKTSDLLAKKDGKQWSIECKRQSKTADYTYRETVKRNKMISYIGLELLNRNILLDIVFHVELETLPDTFLRDLLEKKLPLAVPGKIVSDANVDIDLSIVDVNSINIALKKLDIKHGSPMMNSLIGKKAIDGKAFTSTLHVAKFYEKGEGGMNLFVDEIHNASGVYWSCDAEGAILAKARDVKRQIFAAMEQFNSDETAIIHVGMETFEGPQVEKARFEKIRETFQKLDPKDKKLQWVFLHYFQAYSPPDQNWVYDETVSSIVASTSNRSTKPPLTKRLMVVPEDGDTAEDIYHWERQLP